MVKQMSYAISLNAYNVTANSDKLELNLMGVL